MEIGYRESIKFFTVIVFRFSQQLPIILYTSYLQTRHIILGETQINCDRILPINSGTLQ